MLSKTCSGLGVVPGGLYAPLAVVHLGLSRSQVRHPLDGTGFLTARGQPFNVNGNLWLGSLFPERAPEGHTLLTSYVGGARHPERADWDEGRLLSGVLADLRPLLGMTGDPDYLRIDHHREALPLYHGRYGARLRALDGCLAALPGLSLVANYRGGVSIRDRIAQGLAAAAALQGSLLAPQAGRTVRPQPCVACLRSSA